MDEIWDFSEGWGRKWEVKRDFFWGCLKAEGKRRWGKGIGHQEKLFWEIGNEENQISWEIRDQEKQLSWGI